MTTIRLRQHLGTTSSRVRQFALPPRRRQSSAINKQLQTAEEVDEFLDNPTWSVRSLLPSEAQIQGSSDVTPKELHHLLRLCALPPPADAKEEEKMLRNLKAQLHFVKEIQKVNTDGVNPLASIRDETMASEKTREASLDSLKHALNLEEMVGKYHRRIRRKETPGKPMNPAENWDVLGQAPQKVGHYFVVHTDSNEGS